LPKRKKNKKLKRPIIVVTGPVFISKYRNKPKKSFKKKLFKKLKKLKTAFLLLIFLVYKVFKLPDIFEAIISKWNGLKLIPALTGFSIKFMVFIKTVVTLVKGFY
jgi:hypothetical protein